MFIATLIMFASSTCHVVLEWTTHMILYPNYHCPIGTQFGPPDGINVESTRIENANKYLSMINVSPSKITILYDDAFCRSTYLAM